MWNYLSNEAIIRENKNSKQKMGRIYINSNLDFDDYSHAYWMILAGKLNMPKNVLSFKKMLFYFLLILFHGCFFGRRLQ